MKIKELLESLTHGDAHRIIANLTTDIRKFHQSLPTMIEVNGYEYARNRVLTHIHASEALDFYLDIISSGNPKLQKSLEIFRKLRIQLLDKINSGV